MARPKKTVNPGEIPVAKPKTDYAADVARLNAAGMEKFGASLAGFVQNVTDAKKAYRVSVKTLKKAHSNIMGAFDSVKA